MEKTFVVVAIDYASNRAKNGLSHPSWQTLNEAAQYFRLWFHDIGGMLMCANAHRPQEGLDGKAARAWREDINRNYHMLSAQAKVVFTDATNSIDEASGIRDALEASGIQPSELRIYCDRWHAWRIRIIWRHFFPGVPLTIRKVRCDWTRDHCGIYQRHWIPWALGNLALAIKMKFFGVESATHIKQPIG
jgi:hypothetical protein